MSIGKVHEWKMTEDERLAYIKKHPIVKTAHKFGAQFSTDAIDYTQLNERKKEAFKDKKIIGEHIGSKIHQLYMKGAALKDIATELDINLSTINSYIRAQRKTNPEKWPSRKA